MIQIAEGKNCSGCSACADVCPQKAISLKEDSLGFKYPCIDIVRCIECGLCKKICPFQKDLLEQVNDIPEAYAARHNDIEEVETSRSGAAFIALSDYILKQGGVIYGAAFTDGFKVEHCRATTAEERDRFKGSKYVQSDIKDCIELVKKDLLNGKYVLFSGTPCQVAGVKSAIRKGIQEHLFLVDIICHGVPSPIIWTEYLKYLEKRNKSKIVSANFRDKSFGWSSHTESFVLENGKKIFSQFYTFLFFKHIFQRKSCAACPFSTIQRVGDITLGDFWGWQKSLPNENKDNKGLSLVLVNSAKGEKYWDSARLDMKTFSVEISSCLQPNLQEPSAEHRLRNTFERLHKLLKFKTVLLFYYYFKLKKK